MNDEKEKGIESLSIRIIQISDMHLFADPRSTLLGVNTQKSLDAVLDWVHRKEQHINGVVLSGDLSHDGSVHAYVRLAKTFEMLQVPVYYVPGNHDCASVMMQVYPLASIVKTKQILLKPWQLILLNSQRPGLVNGYLSSAELSFLTDALERYPTYFAVIVLHHQPLVVGSLWLDPLGLRNQEAFWQIVSRYAQVKMILFGHVHQQHQQIIQNIPCYSAPATSIQFAPNVRDFALDHLPPGYRWVNLYSDGHFTTGVERIARYIGIFDESATGY